MKIKKIQRTTSFMLGIFCALAATLLLGPPEAARAAEAPTEAVTNVHQTYASDSYISLEWNGLLQTGINYSIRVSETGSGDPKDWTELSETSSTTDSYLRLPASGASYYVSVLAYTREYVNGTSQKYYGPASDPVEVVTAPTVGSSTAQITQKGCTTDSITLAWDPVSGASQYLLEYYSSKNTSAKSEVTSASNTVTIKKLSANSEYYVHIYAQRTSATGFVAKSSSYISKNSAGSSYTTFPVQPSKADKVTVKNYWENLGEINVGTTGITCAKGYEYELSTAAGKKLTTVSSTSDYSTYISHKKIKKYITFRVRARAYTLLNAKDKVYGSWSGYTYFSQQPKVTKLSSTKSGLLTAWDSISGADRYVIYISTKQKSGYKKAATVKKTSATIAKIGKKKLKKGKTYYVYVVPQKKVSGKYVSLNDCPDCWSKKYQPK